MCLYDQSLLKTQASIKERMHRKHFNHRLIICCLLFIACLVIMMGLNLFGFSVFNDSANIIQIVVGFVGNILVILFLLNIWSFLTLWGLWAAFG